MEIYYTPYLYYTRRAELLDSKSVSKRERIQKDYDAKNKFRWIPDETRELLLIKETEEAANKRDTGALLKITWRLIYKKLNRKWKVKVRIKIWIKKLIHLERFNFRNLKKNWVFDIGYYLIDKPIADNLAENLAGDLAYNLKSKVVPQWPSYIRAIDSFNLGVFQFCRSIEILNFDMKITKVKEKNNLEEIILFHKNVFLYFYGQKN